MADFVARRVQGQWRVAQGTRAEKVTSWLAKGGRPGFFAVVTNGEGADVSYTLLVSTASAAAPVETLKMTSKAGRYSLGEGQKDFDTLEALVAHYGRHEMTLSTENAGTVFLLRGVPSKPTKAELASHIERAATSDRQITNSLLVSFHSPSKRWHDNGFVYLLCVFRTHCPFHAHRPQLTAACVAH